MPERIEAAIVASKHTQESLAEALGVSHVSVYNWVSGTRNPSRANLVKLAAVTGRPAGYFLDEEVDISQAPSLPPVLTTEERLLAMLERQQDIVEKQRLDIANLTEAIRLQQADFLQERDFSRRFAVEQMERVQLELATLRADFDSLRPDQSEQGKLADALARLGVAEQMLASRKLPPTKAGEAGRPAAAGGASNG